MAGSLFSWWRGAESTNSNLGQDINNNKGWPIRKLVGLVVFIPTVGVIGLVFARPFLTTEEYSRGLVIFALMFIMEGLAIMILKKLK